MCLSKIDVCLKHVNFHLFAFKEKTTGFLIEGISSYKLQSNSTVVCEQLPLKINFCIAFYSEETV